MCAKITTRSKEKEPSKKLKKNCIRIIYENISIDYTIYMSTQTNAYKYLCIYIIHMYHK